LDGVFSLPSFGQESQCTLEAYFSPHGGGTEAIVKELNKAKRTVFVRAYPFSSEPIGKALLDAHKKGIRVGVI
jgi:phosphatidylserine/phosphatidylglycerophosphate/cardiolipin synthase-like enzyme